MGPLAYATLPLMQTGMDWPIASVAQATECDWSSTTYDALAHFNQLIFRESTRPLPRDPEPPKEPVFENDEPGGMLTLFVDAFGEENVRRD